jgi:hypothetical protein
VFRPDQVLAQIEQIVNCSMSAKKPLGFGPGSKFGFKNSFQLFNLLPTFTVMISAHHKFIFIQTSLLLVR